MNIKRLIFLFICFALMAAVLVLAGCGGGDCGFSCGSFACGFGCNKHCGFIGTPFLDGCTVVGCGVCDACGSCIGCGIEDAGLRLDCDDKYRYLVGDTAYIRAIVNEGTNGFGEYTEATFVKIESDTTGSARLNRGEKSIRLTADDPGTVTVLGILGGYQDTVVIEFVDIDNVIDDLEISIARPDSDKLYTMTDYQLDTVSNSNVIKVEDDEVQYSLSDNTANATCTGGILRANEPGSVTVKASYIVGDRTVTAYRTYIFTDPEISITPSGTLCIGNRVRLEYEILSSGQMSNAHQYITYTVLSGDATLEKDEYGIYYLIPSRQGTVRLRAEYRYSDISLSTEVDLEITNQGFTVAYQQGSELYVESAVILGAISDIQGFDTNSVVYTIVEGNATVSGNTLVAHAPGEVKILGTATVNGVELESNIMTLTFTYSENTIVTPQDIYKLVNSQETFYLAADIDLSGVESWTPIEGFTGTLVGSGRTIRGLNINVNNLDSKKGFFGTLGGTVKNVRFEANISCLSEAQRIGIVCGENNGRIENVTVSGRINAPYCNYVGGIAGYSNNSYILGCTSNVTVDAGSYIGGIAGYISATRSAAAMIDGNINNGEVRGKSYVGGISGMMRVVGGTNNDTVTVIRCINNAEINATEHYVGGLFGHLEGNYTKTASWEPEYISSIKITDCRNRADVSGKDYVGGILGTSPAYVGEISFCENLGDVTGNMYVGGYVGSSSGTLLKGLRNTNTITGRAYLGGIAGSAGKLDSCENSGTIVPVQYYLDNSNTPLSYVGGIAGYANNVKSCINNSRIDVSYGGHYVGGIVGYLAATRLASETVSGNTNNGEITGTSYVGGIAGWMIVNVGNNNDFITVSNNKNCAPVSGSKNYVGGILGGAAGRFNQNASWDPQYFSYVKITDCHNEAYVSGNDYVGGILGYAPEYVSEIMLSTSIDDVTGNLYVGGFAGYASGTAMRNLKNSNTVTGKTYVGGIAGFAGKLDSCENNGVIVAVRYTLDSDNVALSYVGGIAGYATGATGCTNNSDINVSEGGRYVGGIAGYIHATRSMAENISYNANNGAVKGTSYVGGIAGCIKVKVGNNNDTVLVTENKNYANVTASGDFVGGLFGELAGTFNQGASWDPQYISHIRVTNCHNEANVKGNDYVGGIVGNCREYVEAEAVVWNTNIFLGTVTAVGSHKGDYYGSI